MTCAHVKHLLIGGGVIGLSTAARLCLEGSTLLLEKNRFVGEEVSSRNSEVIHSGIYYPQATVKSRVRKELFEGIDTARHEVPHQKVGKWVLACDEKDRAELEKIRRNAVNVGVTAEFLSRKEIEEEPNVQAVAALSVPVTGIVDSHHFMQALVQLIENRSGDLAFSTEVTGVQKVADGYIVQARDIDGHLYDIKADSVINAGGLWSYHLAKIIMKEHIPMHYELQFCKGHYLKYSGRSRDILRTPKLLYPAPEPGLRGLGIHLTVDMEGMLRFGPDTLYVDNLDYNFSDDMAEKLKEKFLVAIQRYLPVIQKEKLSPAYTGIRPKLVGSMTTFQDFICQEESARGFPGVVNMVGIESPGLTSSLALAEEVASLLGYKARTDAWE